MATLNRLAGVMSATIDGKSFSVSGEGSYTPSSVKRETLLGQDAVHGFSEMPAAGAMSWNGRDGNDALIAALNNMVDGTVVFALANGKTIIGRNMWRVGDPIKVNTEDGTFPCEFEGPDVSEN